MKVRVTIVRPYAHRYWMFHFRKFHFVKGFTIRLFGINIMIIEKNATEKLINIWKFGTM